MNADSIVMYLSYMVMKKMENHCSLNSVLELKTQVLSQQSRRKNLWDFKWLREVLMQEHSETFFVL